MESFCRKLRTNVSLRRVGNVDADLQRFRVDCDDYAERFRGMQ